MEKLRMAFPKGNQAVTDLLHQAGFLLPPNFEESRLYLIPLANTSLELILAKPADIPVYVEYGAADVGIVGKDILLEKQRDVYELLDLQISVGCLSILSIAKPARSPLRVATMYPRLAAEHYRQTGKQVDVIKLSGEPELALLTGLADCVLGVLDKSPSSSMAMGWDYIRRVSDRLIANRASYHIKHKDIQHLHAALQLPMKCART
ncbi:ATP phosphoribosyltransferase [Paenibacillus filicis]|uniref:ATP phosphoribosyltransferase n=1 Tax=Paenibacillus filicis TaxID=669464 RepID=A0ABU9DH18_9BACL